MTFYPPAAHRLIVMVVFVLESLAALLQNGFIVTVLGREWGRSRTLPAGDMTVASLAASRFCLHGMALLNNLLISSGFCSQVYFNSLWDFLNTLTFWLTAWLAIFYCTKIAFFSHPDFLWLKWRVSRLVPRMLLGSLLLSGVSTMAFAATENAVRRAAARSCHGNDTLADRWRAVSRYVFLSRVALLAVPFLLFLGSTLLLMFSLQRHLGQMRDHRAGPRDASTQAHTAALKSLAFFLAFHTSYFLFLIVALGNGATFQNRWRWAWEVVTYAGICLHSSILVQSSPKLRKALKERLRRAPSKELSVPSCQCQ
uniref:Taste receptor type 2 n=1 Tax=Catagonus wagneri TaxID=51154 RepID=A0A8C3W1X3_9CETA